MFSLKNESKKMKIAFGVIVGLFLLITVGSIFYYGDATLLGSFEKYNNDDVKYVRSAETLLNKGMFVYKNVNDPTVFIMPGLPFIIAFFIGVFGSVKGLVAFKIFQAITQTMCLILVFLIGRKVFKNSRVGLIAMILSFFYLPDMWTSHMYLTEAMFRILFLTMFYVLMFAIEEKKMKYYIIAGICFGLSLLFRPPVALFPVVVLVMWIKAKYTFKEAAKYTTVVLLIVVCIMSPWWIRNYKQFNMFIPFTMSTGNPMWLGSYINNDRGGDPLKGTKYDTYRIENVNEKTKPGMNKEIIANLKEVDRAKNRIEAHIKQRPFETLKWYTVGKTSHLFKYPFYWFKTLKPEVFVYHAIIMIISIGGLAIYIRRRNVFSNFMILSMLYFIVVAIPFVCFSRYYYPIMSFSIIIAAYGLHMSTLYFENKYRITKTKSDSGVGM